MSTFPKFENKQLGNFETSRFKDPLVLDLPSTVFRLVYEEVSKLRWGRIATRDSMHRAECDLEGLPFMILITAPVGVEAASHVFAALAIGAAPPVTGKR